MVSANTEGFSITKFDKSISELFYKDASSMDFINKFTIEQINYAAALQSNIYDLLLCDKVNKKSFGTSLSDLKVLVRRWGLDQLYKLFISLFTSRRNLSATSAPKPVIFFAENFVTHILDDFIKIINVTEERQHVLFLSNDMRSVRYIKTKLPDAGIKYIGLRDISFKQFLGAFSEMRFLHKTVRQNTKRSKQVFYRFTSDHNKIRSVFRFNFLMLPFYQRILGRIISSYKPSKVIVGCDAFSLSRVLIDLCKREGVDTYVVQHGMLQAYNGYVPIYADNIFLWSEKEKDFFEQMGFADKGLLVTGAPRFSGVKTNQRVSNGRINITFISSDTYLPEIERSIDVIEEMAAKLTVPYSMTFRPHPHVKLLTEKMYNARKQPVKDTRIHNYGSLNDVLSETDFAIVSNCSTAIFEITAKNIPYRIVESPGAEDSGINLYRFNRSSIDEIVNSIHACYHSHFAEGTSVKTPEDNGAAEHANQLHVFSARKISEYLMERS